MHSHAQHFESHNHHSARRIFLAFLLSLAFSLVELLGGLFLNSVTLLSDSAHSLGDALSTGVSFVLEHLSRHRDDAHHSCHYERYSLFGACFTTLVLFISSALLIYESITRFFEPAEVNADGLLIFSVFGFLFNLLATLVTRHGDSLNQKSVNLHMFEDCLAWLAVFIGAVVMHFTGFALIDPILSIAIALFTLYYALKNTHLIAAALRA